MLRMWIASLGVAGIAVASPLMAQPSGASGPRAVTRSALVSKLDSSFAAADKNHDGFLSTAELGAMQQQSLQQVQARARAELQVRFNQLDTNHDGKLSFDEFATLATVRTNQTAEQIMQKLDSNHDGKVSLDEAKAPEISAFDRIDTNHDGVASVAEQAAANRKK